VGWVSEASPNKNIILLFLKPVLCFLKTIFTGGLLCRPQVKIDFYFAIFKTRFMFPENDFYWRFIMPTASENRFSLAVVIRL
jgi:hypothetical protein